jgi:hypothetical protein
MDWFERLTGFREAGYDSTRSRLEIDGERLRSTINGRTYGIGHLETPTLADLRERAAPLASSLTGPIRVSCVSGDIRALHRDPAYRGALFQVASQFNLLEMTGPNVSPEDGVTRYAHDRTQGPACAIAAGAATIYRNYFVPFDGRLGQTRERQIDCLRDAGDALGNVDGSLWTMRNGYALCTETGLATIDSRLRVLDAMQVDGLRDLVRIGVHWNVEVTDADEPRPSVTQAFCSALPVAYTGVAPRHWRAFASLVLEAAYEATLWAGVANACSGGSPVVLLTQLGGGAFGNDPAWIQAAQVRALDAFSQVGLDVRLVSYGLPRKEVSSVATRYRVGK